MYQTNMHKKFTLRPKDHYVRHYNSFLYNHQYISVVFTKLLCYNGIVITETHPNVKILECISRIDFKIF